MRMTRYVLAGVALASLAPLGTAGAQDADERRALERERRAVAEQLRDIERRLMRLRSFERSPLIVDWSSSRAQLGVIVQTAADPETDEIGAVLESITPDTPAEDAGLQAGDIVVSFNGEPLTGRYPPAAPDESEPAIKLIDLVGDQAPGDTVSLEFIRDGRSQTTTAILEELMPGVYRFGDRAVRVFGGGNVRLRTSGRTLLEQPRFEVLDQARGNVFISIQSDFWSDIELVSLNEELGRYFGTNEGLLVIRPPEDGPMDLQAGDVILSIDGREVGTPSRALRILRSYEVGESIDLEIMRDQHRVTVSFVVPEADLFYDGNIEPNFFRRQRRY